MKNCIRYAWAALLLLVLASCTKSPEARFAGSYTYKTGGSLLLESVADPAKIVSVSFMD